MKSIILKTTLFSSIVIALFFFILSRADGYTDPYYIRFTTSKQSNLVIGTSRSAQGIQPFSLEKTLNKKFFNYSFTISHSPFGPVYLNSIKKKLNEATNNGIFIVSVNPWSISSKSKDPNDIVNFRENKLILATTNSVNKNPNFGYLIKNLEGNYAKILTNKIYSPLFLHKDGWLEVTAPMDSVTVENRIQNRVEIYRANNLPFYKFSTVRLNYLKKTIEYLKLHGKVYLVRLPIHPKMFELDSMLVPEFNEIIAPVIKMADGYLDMTNENNMYQYTDGNHLYKESGKLVSIKIADWIKEKNITNE